MIANGPGRFLGPRPRRVGLVVVCLAGCGDRTGLAGVAPDAAVAGDAAPDGPGVPDGTTDGPRPASCGAPDPSEPLSVAGPTVEVVGNVAGSDCSFGVTWQANENGHLAIVARTAYVSGGRWTLSPTRSIDFPEVPIDSANQGTIGWDGSAYLVAWTAGSRLFMRRLSPEGLLLGPTVRSVATGIDSYVAWIDPSPGDGAVRLGLLDDRGSRFTYHLYFLEVTTDGTSVVPAVDVTPAANDAAQVGFIHLPTGYNRLYWTDDGHGAIRIFETDFDDLGHLVQPTADVLPRLSAGCCDYLPGGAALAGEDAYFGVLEYRRNRSTVLVGLMDPAGPGHSVVTGIEGDDRPGLAATGGGLLGVLTGRVRTTDTPTDLLLSVVSHATTTATRLVVHDDAISDSYSLAAGSASFAAFWQTGTSDLKLTVVTP